MSRFDLHLTPLRDGEAWTGFDVHYTVGLDVAAGEPLLTIPDMIVSIPAASYATGDLRAADDHGALALTEGERTADSTGSYRHWVADRDIAGTLELAVRAPVRPTDAQTPVGPLFDLRAEDRGLFGAGITFLPLPETRAVFDVTLTWHLARGEVGISGHGTGDAAWTGPTQSIAFCHYGAGAPVSAPADAPEFGIHAFAEPPFDLDEVADFVGELHSEMVRFFADPGSSYHVLVRRNPGQGTGGTALPGTFAFGFSSIDTSDDDELRSLLAHEMAHAWPKLDADHSDSAWYTEGTAEYYSHVLPLRGGFLSREAFARQLTERIQQYDANVLRTLDNTAAGAAFWADPRAQRIPYGRGLRYLIATDGLLRRATDGAVSLDDLVLGVLETQRGGGTVDLDEWVRRVGEHLPDAAERFAAMVAGEPIALPDMAFEGVVPVVTTICEFELGFDAASFRSEGRAVHGLIAGSAAEAAGLREGDVLVERSLPHHTLRRSDAPLTFHVFRGSAEHTITYVPAGREVASVRWEVP